MDNEPKGGSLPIIAGGVLMAICCLAPVLLGSVFLGSVIASVSAWFGDLNVGETAALALLAAALVYGAIRLRITRNAVDADKPSPTIE